MTRRIRYLSRASGIPSMGSAIVEPDLGPILEFLNELTGGAVLDLIYHFKQF